MCGCGETADPRGERPSELTIQVAKPWSLEVCIPPASDFCQPCVGDGQRFVQQDLARSVMSSTVGARIHTR
jgi:hypothetical protein